MYLIINNRILPYFIGLVKKKRLIYYLLKKENIDFLKFVAKIIKKNKINFKDIRGIIIIPDFSSFSGLRKIITLANILGRFLDIPLSLVKINEAKTIKEAIKIGKKRLKKRIILPTYYKEPNITKLNLNHKINKYLF